MPHVHGSAASEHRRRLLAVFLLTIAIFGVELVGGLVSNSLALLADAGHMFTDVAGIGLALLAIWIGSRCSPMVDTVSLLSALPQSDPAPWAG